MTEDRVQILFDQVMESFKGETLETVLSVIFNVHHNLLISAAGTAKGGERSQQEVKVKVLRAMADHARQLASGHGVEKLLMETFSDEVDKLFEDAAKRQRKQ